MSLPGADVAGGKKSGTLARPKPLSYRPPVDCDGVVWLVLIVIGLATFGTLLYRADRGCNDVATCGAKLVHWLPGATAWEVALFLSTFLAFIYACHTGDNEIFGDWAPGATLMLVVGVLVVRLHEYTLGAAVGITVGSIAAYAAIGVGYSFLGLWWEIRRRGVMSELVRNTTLDSGPASGTPAGTNAERIFASMEGTVLRMMMYWPFALARQVIFALIYDMFTFVVDKFKHVYVRIVARMLSSM